MRITFGKKNDGGWGITPTHEFNDWYLAVKEPARLVYKPSTRTMLVRCFYAGLLLAMAACAQYYKQSYTPEARPALTPNPQAAQELDALTQEMISTGMMTAEEIERIKAQSSAKVSAKRASLDSLNANMVMGLNITAGIFVLLATLPIISGMRGRLALRIEPNGSLAVAKLGLRSYTTHISKPKTGIVLFGAEEMVERNKHGQPLGSYYQWFIRVMEQSEPTAPPSEVLSLHPLRWKDRPGAQPKPPTRIREILELLYHWSGARVDGPHIVDEETERTGLLRRKHVKRLHTNIPVGEPRVVRQVDTTVPLPEGLKGRTGASLRIEGGGPDQPKAYIFDDGQGNTQVFGSPDEMPPDVRNVYDYMEKLRHGGA